MKLPAVISKAVLKGLAQPAETHAVRVLLHDAPNHGIYRLRCARRQYLFEKDGTIGVHSLDIPVSVWMDGCPPGRYRDNHSVAQDFRGTGATKWSIQIVPWKGAVSVQAPVASAPVEQAAPAVIAPSTPEHESPIQRRARAMREAKAAKKAARELESSLP